MGCPGGILEVEVFVHLFNIVNSIDSTIRPPMPMPT